MRERGNRGLRGAGEVAAWLLLWVAAGAFAAAPRAAEAQVTTTAVSDGVFQADGTAASGTVLISWPAFTTAAGQSVPKGSTAVTLDAGGELHVSLAPNAGATPAGTFYTVVYHLNDGSTSREYWVVPVSSTAVKLASVRNQVLPSSVAMQTVSKQYVDQAIARAALTGVVPQDASPYVEKAGDTMTGPLVLAGDPVSAQQAATKNYVDTTAAGLQAGLGQKVSTAPQGTQTVTQPAGTQLQVNNLNGELYAKQYQTPGVSDGIANAQATSDCAAGCSVIADPSYGGTDAALPKVDGSRVVDQRAFQDVDSTLNTKSGFSKVISSTWTMPTPQRKAIGANVVNQYALQIQENALAGGSNVFAGSTPTIPYFKTTYAGTSVLGVNNTQGQHVLNSASQRCYGVGDCLIGSQFIYNSGGIRDQADEGSHPFDIQITEDTNVFQGTCSTGCTTGATTLVVSPTSGAGTQGDGRFLIDKAPSKTISTGQIIGRGSHPQHSSVLFSGVSFPVSTFFTTVNVANSRLTDVAPGTVTLEIQTSGVAPGYSTNTASASATTGLACLANLTPGNIGTDQFEMAPYTIVDGTHIQVTLNKPKYAGATIALGGMCGYGIEQTADTYGPIKQVFPVIGAVTPTQVLYSALATPNLGQSMGSSAFVSYTSALTSLQRNGNTVTGTLATSPGVDLSGLSLTITDAADSSFNGTFAVTATSATQFTYSQTGPNATTTGGTASVVNGSYNAYPMAEVLSVLNTSTKTVDGTLTLAPNTVAWAAGDPVEEPHYYQLRENADISYVTQYEPRGLLQQQAGVQYNGVVGLGVTGWMVYNNAPASQYYGNGGTHTAPQTGLWVRGVWDVAEDVQAGETTAFSLRCNSHGCGKWSSTYNLFTLQSSAGADAVVYSPSTSTMQFNLRGAAYSMSPTSLTAGTINATTLNVTRINGMQQATASDVGGVTLGPAATSSVLANVATSGSASDLTSGTIDPARLPAGVLGGVCASNVAYSATPVFAVSCANATFHMPLTGNVTGESFTGLSAGQHITLIFQVGGTPGYTVAWSPSVHGGFVTSATSGTAGYTQAGKYLVQQLVVDTDGVTLLNPGAINE